MGLVLHGAGWGLCRDSSWPLWQGTPEGFSKGHSKSWTLQPLHVCPRATSCRKVGFLGLKLSRC